MAQSQPSESFPAPGVFEVVAVGVVVGRVDGGVVAVTAGRVVGVFVGAGSQLHSQELYERKTQVPPPGQVGTGHGAQLQLQGLVGSGQTGAEPSMHGV